MSELNGWDAYRDTMYQASVSTKQKAKEVLKEVDTEVVKGNIGIVLDTIETINKTNTTIKADNIQKGVQDARKVLGVLSLLKAVLIVFKRK